MGARLFWDAEETSADIRVEGTTIAAGSELETALILSLFTNRRANDDDTLPPGVTDRGGYWADELPGQRRRGSRLWLLMGQGITKDLLRRVDEMAREALEWFVSDGIADEVEVEVTRSGTNSIRLFGALIKGSQRTPFDFLWSN